MTRTKRIWNIISGVFMILMGLGLFIDPKGGLSVVAFILSLTFTVRGFQALWYYVTMARFMVGGRRSLYRGFIFLELGLLTNTMRRKAPELYIVLYLAGLLAFSGVVEILAGLEARKLKAPAYRTHMINGATDLFVAIAVLIGGFVINSITIVMYGYGAGLIYTGAVRIGAAFRRTSIVYIQ